MAAEKYLSRHLHDSHVGNNIGKIDKNLVPSSIRPWRNSASTLVYAENVRDKFSTLAHYEHAIVRWYTLPYGEEIPKFCVCIKNLQRMLTYCLYVRHKLDVHNRSIMHTLR